MLENTRIHNCRYGIYAPWEGEVTIDLGRVGSPGTNTIVCSEVGLTLAGTYRFPRTFYVAGNTWAPNTQGSDGTGRFPALIVKGPLQGKNFKVSSDLVSLQF
jgi:hypothetical protein